MKTAIEEIFRGEQININNMKMSQKYWENLRLAIKLEKEFEKKLSPELKKEFEVLSDALDGVDSACAEDHFIQGVKFGIRLGVEACK